MLENTGKGERKKDADMIDGEDVLGFKGRHSGVGGKARLGIDFFGRDNDNGYT